MASNSTGICTTAVCVKAASAYLANLSPNYTIIDPCTNFEEYTCGGWRTIHEMRPDQGMVDALGLINDDITSTIRKILEGSYPETSAHSAFSPRNLEVSPSVTDRENFNKLKAAYNACMDVDTITKRGISPIVQVIDELATMMNSSKATDYSDVLIFFEERAANSFFGYYAGDDDKDPENQIIRVSPAQSVGLPSKEYFGDKKVVQEYEDAIAKVLGAIHPTVAVIRSPADAAKAIVDLEARLSLAAPDKEDMDDVTQRYNPMSIKDTAKLLEPFGIEKVLQRVVPANYTVSSTVVSFPHVLANISQIVAATPREDVVNYLYWQLIANYDGVVLGPEIQPYRQFQNVLHGRSPDAVPDRWRTCVSQTSGTLGWILSRFFVEVAFSAAAKDFGNQIISDIKKAYLEKFTGLTWMDDATKKVAIEKVNNIDQKVGYPAASPNIMDPEDLQKYYEPINITNSYFENAVSSDRFLDKRVWSSLGKPTDMKEWSMMASTVNAYYNPPHNEIVFPAAIMQLPLFSVDLPSYISYGAFGAVAGHELSHAFDNNGRHFDVRGRLNDWWTNETVAAFEKRTQCIVDEFNNFTVIGKDGPIHVKGRQTLGENIADSGGISAAWLAWKDRLAAASTGTTGARVGELGLPGLEHFTHEQLFFVSYGNAWCSKFRPAMMTSRVLGDVHSPDPIRALGTVANSRGFREAFNCPVKEPTCELW